ncbi:MAG: choice-of-anchor V domain-containing protein, partial [Rhodothermales bacterium]|nr:choice-of-anchor V domain-containing protein [Rhodothermales bacterium]
MNRLFRFLTYGISTVFILGSVMALSILRSDGDSIGSDHSWHGGGAADHCWGCHSGGSDMTPNSPTFAISAPSTFTPGDAVTVSVTFGATGRGSHGFMLSTGDPDNGDANVEGLTITDATNTQLTLSSTVVTHTNTGQTSWSFQWVPPNPAPSRVTFWAAGAAADARNDSDVYRDSLTIFNDTVLPVELASFDVRLDGSTAVLDWRTLSEDNNVGFDVQHAQGTDTFEAVGFVQGAGTTSEARDYSYTVAELVPGAHRFRLRQIDVDGTTSYSDQVEVTVAVPERFLLSEAYPNPFNPTTTIELAVKQEQDVRVRVYDEMGRHVTDLFS